MPPPAYAIVGDGRIGTALAARLSESGARVRVHGPAEAPAAGGGRHEAVGADAGEVAVLCLPDGVIAGQVVASLCEAAGRPRVVLDLTTQGLPTAIESGRRCSAAGIAYAAGGVLGGQAQVRAGQAAAVLGPCVPCGEPFERAWARLHWTAEAISAVRSKLIHNYVSLRSQAALADALAAMGVHSSAAAAEVAAVLESGPAGRRLREVSVVRDWDRQATTSYPAGLVRKDLALIAEEFLSLRGPCEETAQRLDGPDEMPFTTAFARSARRRVAAAG